VTEMVKLQKEARLQKKVLTAAQARAQVETNLSNWSGEGILSRAGRYMTTSGGIASRGDFLGKLARKITTPDEAGTLVYKALGKLGPGKLFSGVGLGAGFLAALPFLPGALVPSQRPEELEALYRGEKEVAIRK